MRGIKHTNSVHFEKHSQWPAVKETCEVLRKHGHQALLAGGCVRDLLMGREPHDFDIATDATPDQVEALFPHAIGVGKAFGVMVVPFAEGFHLEVATFRRDLDYHDGRRPKGVEFSDAKTDAERRDFTVNALFFDPETNQVVDYFNGEDDIHLRVIRTVGDPLKRFAEDYLRLVRAIRFVAQLGFTIAPETLQAIKQLASHARGVSRERVRDEMFKLLKAPDRRQGLELMVSSGLISALFPDLAPLVAADPERWLDRLERSPIEAPIAQHLALFFMPHFEHGEEQVITDECMKDLRLDNQLTKDIVFALKHYRDFLTPERLREGELILLLANRASSVARGVANLLEDEAASFASLKADHASASDRDLRLEELQLRTLGAKCEKPSPLLTGEDLKALGVAAGPQMGALLHEAYLQQLEGKLASRQAALVLLAEWIKQGFGKKFTKKPTE